MPGEWVRGGWKGQQLSGDKTGCQARLGMCDVVAHGCWVLARARLHQSPGSGQSCWRQGVELGVIHGQDLFGGGQPQCSWDPEHWPSAAADCHSGARGCSGSSVHATCTQWAVALYPCRATLCGIVCDWPWAPAQTCGWPWLLPQACSCITEVLC